MPRLAGLALTTPLGDLEATAAVLPQQRASCAAPLAEPLLALLERLARQALAGATPDLVLLATTKADLPQWCDALLAGPGWYAGGPAACAHALGTALGAPAYAVSAACASAPTALAIAGRALVHGRARRVLVVAADRLGAFVRDGFVALGALDAAGCRPFDRDRAGLALGETAAAVVLTADDAAGIHLLGWGGSLDANHLTGPTRDGSGLARAVARCLGDQLRPAVIVGHGTGTRYNDDSESLAYARLLPGVPVVGWKGAFGHSLGACGLTEVALAAQALTTGRWAGTVGHAHLGCAGAITVLPPGPHTIADAPALVANAGFGGVNAAVALGPERWRRPGRATRRTMSVRGRVQLDGAGWSTADGASGRWSARSPAGLPLLPQAEAAGARWPRPDPLWGRMDLACRALIALASRLPPLPFDAGVVLVTERGCAASDRLFEQARRAGQPEPQRFAYTLPSTPVGELSIRAGLTGPGCALLGATDAQARAVAEDLLADGCPAVLLARVEADDALDAWAEALVAEGAP